MPTNKYFKTNFISQADQNLLDQLTVEAIQINGRDVLYIPRQFVAFDKLYGEDKLSMFSTYYEIEMYLETFSNFGGAHEVASQFGFDPRDKMTLAVSKTRFNDLIGKKASLLRPREGDLIYFPYDQSLFEISFVDNEEIFYQLGKVFTYQIYCNRFDLGAEQFNTQVPTIDNIPKQYGNVTSIMLANGSGTYIPGEIVYQLAADDIKTNSATYNEAVYDSFNFNSSSFGGIAENMAGVNSGTYFAEVISFNASTGMIILTKTKGIVDLSKKLLGFTSLATWNVVTTNVGEVDQVSDTTNAANQNETIDALSIPVVDRTKSNPQAYGY